MDNADMQIYSGSCCKCDIGIPTKETDWNGNELFSGDIVQLWHGNYIGTDCEEWLPSSGLTAIVGQQYQSYSDDSVKLVNNTPRLFTMGISNTGVQGGDWKVTLVKSHKDVVEGERFPSFGFNFKRPTDAIKEIKNG